jgi:hypothetical protein
MVPPMMRHGGARKGGWLVGSLLVSTIGAACGDDEGNGEDGVVTADEVREFYGLVPGTCLVYGFGTNNALTATVFVDESDPNAYPGRDEVVWELVAANSGTIRRFLEPQDGGRVVMIQDESRPGGDLVTRVYAGDDGVEPLFAQFRRAAGETLDFAGSTFRTQNARPSFTIEADGGRNEDPPIEDHRWEVVEEDVDVGLEPPYDTTFQLSYRIEREQTQGNAQFNFVPNVGFVRIQDFTPEFGGTARPGGGNLPNVFLLRDARVCMNDGTCEGDPPECPAVP